MEHKYGFRVTPLSEEDGGGFLVEVPDLLGCIADGETYEEAIAKMEDAIESWISVAKEEGREIPKPKEYKEDEYSGKILARLPKSLHRDIANLAKKEGTSINQVILTSCAKEVGRQEFLTQPFSKECGKNNSSCKITFETNEAIMSQMLGKSIQSTWNMAKIKKFEPINLVDELKYINVRLENIKLESVDGKSEEENGKLELYGRWVLELLDIKENIIAIKAVSKVGFKPEDVFNYEAEYRCLFKVEDDKDLDPDEIKKNIVNIVDLSPCASINSLLLAQLSDKSGNFPIIIPPTVSEDKKD